MNILLTGGSGMVGRNVLEHAAASKHNILSPTSQQLNLLFKKPIMDFLKQERVDMVIHTAGLVGGIQANMANPVSFLVDNMQMGLNLISAAKDCGIERLLNLSSSCMYPKDAVNPLTENLILFGQLEPTNEGYALAKIVSTRLCEYVSKENSQFLYKTIIPCNLYGKYDKFDLVSSHMIPAVIKKLYYAKKQGEKTVSIWGDGLARREFMYAGDLADFIFYAIDNFTEMPQNINVGLGKDYSINDYYSIIAKVMGVKCAFIHDLTKPVGMKRKLIDNSKLKKFGWNHSISLKSGIEKTYHYYLEIGK